ncbi:hypothetical protein H8959_002548 [Pygathrix nigripes]
MVRRKTEEVKEVREYNTDMKERGQGKEERDQKTAIWTDAGERKKEDSKHVPDSAAPQSARWGLRAVAAGAALTGCESVDAPNAGAGVWERERPLR